VGGGGGGTMGPLLLRPHDNSEVFSRWVDVPVTGSHRSLSGTELDSYPEKSSGTRTVLY
jgi:hypothetical protein